MLYMIIEDFRDGDPVPVYRRFRDSGRQQPAGLIFHGSWITEDFTRCYQVMECDDPHLLDQWMSRWTDVIRQPVNKCEAPLCSLFGVSSNGLLGSAAARVGTKRHFGCSRGREQPAEDLPSDRAQQLVPGEEEPVFMLLVDEVVEVLHPNDLDHVERCVQRLDERRVVRVRPDRQDPARS